MLDKDESIGLAVTESGKNYFLLDSKEYWYDLVQEKFPKKLRCKCKSNLFYGKLKYCQRDGCSDFCKVELITKCASCGAEKNQLELSLDYSPTEGLYKSPLVFCANPNLKYKTYQFNSLWTASDAVNLIKSQI